MNVLFITEFYPPNILGGGEINIKLLSEVLSEKVNVVVLTSSVDKKSEEKYDFKIKKNFKNLKILRVLKSSKEVSSFKGNFIRSFVFKKSFFDYYNKNKSFFDSFDIIHFFGNSFFDFNVKGKKVYSVESNIVFCPKGDLLFEGKSVCSGCNYNKFKSCIVKSPEIGRMKNYFFLKYNFVFKKYLWNRYNNIKISLNSFDGFIAVSSFVKKMLEKNINNKKVEVIGNIVFENEKKEFEISYENLKVRKFDVVYLGSLNYFKGLNIFLESLKKLKDENIVLKAAVFGSGNKKKYLEFCKKNSLDVSFFDFVKYENIGSVFKNSKLVVVPSIVPEAFGRIPLESLYYDTPVIVSDSGALKENISLINEKLVFKNNNVESLTFTIKYFFENIKNVDKIYEKEKVLKLLNKFNKKNIVEKIINFYKSL